MLAGLKQWQVARRLGWAPSTLCLIENGRRGISEWESKKILSVLGQKSKERKNGEEDCEAGPGVGL
jgi:hypothetical protein